MANPPRSLATRSLLLTLRARSIVTGRTESNPQSSCESIDTLRPRDRLREGQAPKTNSPQVHPSPVP